MAETTRNDAKDGVWAEFELGRVADCLFEAGKQSTHDSVLFLVLLASASLLAFPEDVSKEVTVPAFGFSLKISYAAEVLVVLTCASLYRLLASRHMEKLLGYKILQLIEQKGRHNFHPWYLYFPSLFNFHGHMFDSTSRRIRSLSYVFGFLYFFGFLSIVILLVRIGFVYSFSLHWFVTACVAVALLSASLILAIEIPRRNSASEIVTRIEAYRPNEDEASKDLDLSQVTTDLEKGQEDVRQ